MEWNKEFPKVDGDYYSRIDEYDKQPTPIRIENGAVYEFGAQGSLRREYEAEDYEYFGPITPAQAEQFEALRTQLNTAADLEMLMRDEISALRKVSEAALRCLQGDGDKTIDQVKNELRRALGKE